ncbi:GNAT family N-acetyltransferase [Actinoplanes sp. URMC 104]|uniref:GNAT family N-acetyltransferase n=1 Tax=Actinoplanes sp. URMC 104 TaxID=3423409 RepID=UPI003F1D9349
MIDDPLLIRARRLWVELAAAPVAFGTGADVAVSPRSLLCPPGWAGIVTLAGSAIVTVPDETRAVTVRAAFAGVPATSLTDPAVVRARLAVTEVLGPATLAFCDADRFRPLATDGVEAVSVPALRTLLDQVDSDDADEAGLGGISSPAFVLRDGDAIVAAAGYHLWPAGTAHLSVLTAPGHRDRGLARIVASAAVAAALSAGLMPQWRARPPASRRVARALGFEVLGAQLSLRLDQP